MSALRRWLMTGLLGLVAGLWGCGGGWDDGGKRRPLGVRVAADYTTVVQHLYVAYYGRPADPAGLAFWADYLAQGDAPTDLTAFASAYANNPAVKTVVDNFGRSAESLALYGTDNAEVVRAIYRNLFNRAPDAEGLKFYVDGLNAGVISLAQAAVMIANGAQGSDGTSVGSKVSVAARFTQQVELTSVTRAYDGLDASAVVRQALSRVTAGTDAVEAAGNLLGSLLSPRVKVLGPSAAVGGWVMFDPSGSQDPMGLPLTFDWKVVSAPAGWSGFGYADARGRVGFSNSGRDGEPVWGTFVFTVTAQSSSRSSEPLRVEVEMCCESRDPIQKASDFNRRLPVYTVEQARAAWAAQQPRTVDEMFRVAGLYGFSIPQVEFLAGYEPGYLMEMVRSGSGFNAFPPNGGATITGYTQNFSNVLQIAADPARVDYPGDFSATRAQRAAVVDPFCSQDAPVITLRAEDLGDAPLPTIKARPLGAGVLRMATIKDIYSVMNPNIGQGCVKDIKKAWTLTLDRLAKMNVNAISVTPWSYFDARSNPWQIPLAGTLSGSGMGDESLATVVAEAHARNIKVYWVNQLQYVVKPDGSLLSSGQTTAADVEQALTALQTYLGERAASLQRLGVDGMILGSWYWVNFGGVLTPQRFSQANVNLIAEIRKRFTGRILYGPASDSDMTTALNAVVDGYVYIPGPNLPSMATTGYTVAALLSSFEGTYASFKAAAGSTPIHVDLGVQSRKGYLTDNPGYFDPFCTPLGSDPCVQRRFAGDYAFQAIYTEAGLEFMASRPAADIGGVMMSYFIDDNLLPTLNFFNIDASVRGKPAEVIFQRWFTAK